MSGTDGGWPPDFPEVMRFVDPQDALLKPWQELREHPDYRAAKTGASEEAAIDLVEDFLRRPENMRQLAFLKQAHQDAVIVAVHAEEAGGRNKIPQALAKFIGKMAGIGVDDSIVQTNIAQRTGKDELYRFAFRASFGGEVQRGRDYVLVDDVFAMGGSLNELRLHVERGGGRVVRMAALSIGGHGNIIAPSRETLGGLLDRHGEKSVQSFLEDISLYEGNHKTLTEPEAASLRRTPSLDAARDRILAARQEGCVREDGQIAGPREAPRPEVEKPKPQRKCGRRL